MGVRALPPSFKAEIMAEFPGFTIWTDAYLADTTHLTTLEHGAYYLLLIAMWRAGGYLPNDDKRLARFAKLNDTQWLKMKPTMMDFFKVVDGEITQGRLLDELEKARNRSSRASENARSKYRKTKDQHQAPAVPEASQKPASISISIDTDKKEPAVPKKGTRIPEDFEPDLDEAVRLGVPMQMAIKEAANFRDYWTAKSGKDATKLDWPATWRMWCRNGSKRYSARSSPAKSQFRQHQDDVTANLERMANERSTAYDDGQPAFDLDPSDFRSERTASTRKR